MNTTTQAHAQAIHDADWLRTGQLAHFALTWHAYSATASGMVWERISWDQDSARDYYAGLDQDQLREEASEALAGAGWTVRAIAWRLS